MLQKSKLSFVLFIIAVILSLPSTSWASTSNRTINSTNKYAWSDNIGWVNFGTTTGNIQITDSGITGYAWSSEYGWINMNPSTSGVTISSSGVLSGSAWGENTGWIDFSGVTLDSDGYFTGNATGTIIGTLSMNCSNTSSCSTSDFKVSTDYRPADYRGGGNILSIVNIAPPQPMVNDLGQPLFFQLAINNQATETNSRNVTLTISNASAEVIRMAISNRSDFQGASQIAYTPISNWQLTEGDGIKTVYVKLYSSSGTASDTISDTILLNTTNGQPTNQTDLGFGQYQPSQTDTTSQSSNNRSIANGNLVKEIGRSDVYLIYKDFYKRPIISGQVFEACGYNWDNIIEKNSLADYTTAFPITLLECSNTMIDSPSTGIGQYLSNQTISNNFTFTKNLYPGDQDPEVKALQQFLNNNGYTISTSGGGRPGYETDYFGNLTKQALIKFQENYAAQILTPSGFSHGTGIFGPATRDFVNNFKSTNNSSSTTATNQAVLGQKITKTKLPSAEFKFGLGLGMTNDDIRRLQILLATMPDIYPDGRVTGYFGPLTEEAIQKFQLKYEIITPNHPAYGYVGPATRIKLLEIFG